MCDKILNSRTNLTNPISVMMDGGETKHNNVITLLTTNHIEDVDPTFLRGKRIGTIVTFTHLDRVTAKAMIERLLIDENGQSILEEDCEEAAEAMEVGGIVPAFLAEILDRVKSHMIYSDKTTVSNQDIISSLKTYQRQIEIGTVKRKTETDEQALIRTIKKVFFVDDGKGELNKVEMEKIFGRAGLRLAPETAAKN